MPDAPATVAPGTVVGPGAAVVVGPTDPLADAVSAVAGVPTGSAVPTLPAVLALAAGPGRGGPRDLLEPLLRARPDAAVVHGDQRIESVRPVRAGDRLVLTSTATSVRTLGSSTVLTVETDVGTPDGDPVARLRSSFVVTGSAT